MPVYNGERYIAETLASVERQTYGNWEIIAIDDGSEDGSAELLRGWSDRLRERCRVVTVKNGGVSRARNTGATIARGDYIAFIDQDDLWEPEKLAKQVHLIERDPEARVVYTNMSFIGPQGSILRRHALRLGERHRGNIFEQLLFYDFIPISSVIVEAALFRRSGGFNPDFRLAEDFDLLLRLSRLSRIEYIDEPLLLYRLHEGNASRNVDSINEEAARIVRTWQAAEPGIVMRHPLKYTFFRANLVYMKFKSLFYS